MPGLLIHRYNSPLFFANAEDFRRRAPASVAARDEPVDRLVLNTEADVEVDVEVDITALDAVEALRHPLDAYGLTAKVGPERIFPTLPTAVAAYRDWQRATGRAPAL
ncbi:hypothetical protein [Streptomyces sp. 3211]|uniref:hypothetical protein n=1 Tax=Streptomyces sp. 3211 TaxID=1964449 RepID=UPI001842E798